MRTFVLGFGLLLQATLAGQNRQVAITIDDLPRGGDLPGGCTWEGTETMTRKLLEPFQQCRLPVTGFVNAGRCGLTESQLTSLLNVWLDAGAELGNHTYSHPNIHTAGLAKYKEDVTAGEAAIRRVLSPRGRKLVYFRHPFLFEGDTAEKRDALAAFLKERGYEVAPVTLDTSDYLFAAAYGRAKTRGDDELATRVRVAYIPYLESIFEYFEKRSVEVFGREIPQILLIHANQLNAASMNDMLAMMKRRGYTVVSLATTLSDEAYRTPEHYVARNGVSWLHRWAKEKGLPQTWEPDPPEFVSQASEQQ